MPIRKIIFSLLILLLASLMLSSLIYGGLLLKGFSNQPTWALYSFPFFCAIIILFFLKEPFLSTLNTGVFYGFVNWKNLILFFSIPLLTCVLFQPLANSLRYNVANVLTIQSIKELKQHENTAFLEVEKWYVDKMQVLPINTVKQRGMFQRSKVELNALFLVPVFSKDEAYKSFARAWLAIEYSQIVNKKELDEKKGHPFFKSSLIHFRRLNLLAFNYLEDFPRGANREVFTSLTRSHSFYKSGYGNIFRGQDVDRDILSAYYFKYSLFLGAILATPSLIVLALLLAYLQKRNNGFTQKRS